MIDVPWAADVGRGQPCLNSPCSSPRLPCCVISASSESIVFKAAGAERGPHPARHLSLYKVKEVFLQCPSGTQKSALILGGGGRSSFLLASNRTPAAHWPGGGGQGGLRGPVQRLKVPDGGAGVRADLTTLSDARGAQPPVGSDVL